jgi:hypothetical protein
MVVRSVGQSADPVDEPDARVRGYCAEVRTRDARHYAPVLDTLGLVELARVIDSVILPT